MGENRRINIKYNSRYMSSGFPGDTVGSETDVFELETRRFVVPTNRSRILAGGAK